MNNKQLLGLLCLVTLLVSNISYSKGKQFWLENHYHILRQQFACKPNEPTNDQSPCNYFVSNVLNRGWGLSDFGTTESHMSASQISTFVASNSNWHLLGSGDDQSALTSSQAKANEGYPVIAVTSGHVAMIVPGQLIDSGSWRLKVPNSASFRLNNVSASYVDKGLNYSWKASDKGSIKLYYRSL